MFRNTEIASEMFKSWTVISVADKREGCFGRRFQESRQSGN